VARTYLVFGDIEGKLDVLRVECTRYERKGRYSVAGWGRLFPKPAEWPFYTHSRTSSRFCAAIRQAIIAQVAAVAASGGEAVCQRTSAEGFCSAC
jgi:hypothetical protein